MSIKI